MCVRRLRRYILRDVSHTVRCRSNCATQVCIPNFVYMVEYSAFFSGQGGEGVATLLPPTEGVL